MQKAVQDSCGASLKSLAALNRILFAEVCRLFGGSDGIRLLPCRISEGSVGRLLRNSSIHITGALHSNYDPNALEPKSHKP